MITIRITHTFNGRWRVASINRDGTSGRTCSGSRLFVALRLFTHSCHYDSRAMRIDPDTRSVLPSRA